jgi:hypothetical protein
MKPKEQRIAIAKACGWEKKYSSMYDKKCWYNELGTKVAPTQDQLPDYLNNLNAMHEAEKTLSDDQFMDYHGNLGCLGDYGSWWNKNLTHATASKRAEAFLKTLNLWKHE